jgi:hypothetical protein
MARLNLPWYFWSHRLRGHRLRIEHEGRAVAAVHCDTCRAGRFYAIPATSLGPQ